jgi:hypothetical protein
MASSPWLDTTFLSPEIRPGIPCRNANDQV